MPRTWGHIPKMLVFPFPLPTLGVYPKLTPAQWLWQRMVEYVFYWTAERFSWTCTKTFKTRSTLVLHAKWLNVLSPSVLGSTSRMMNYKFCVEKPMDFAFPFEYLITETRGTVILDQFLHLRLLFTENARVSVPRNLAKEPLQKHLAEGSQQPFSTIDISSPPLPVNLSLLHNWVSHHEDLNYLDLNF